VKHNASFYKNQNSRLLNALISGRFSISIKLQILDYIQFPFSGILLDSTNVLGIMLIYSPHLFDPMLQTFKISAHMLGAEIRKGLMSRRYLAGDKAYGSHVCLARDEFSERIDTMLPVDPPCPGFLLLLHFGVGFFVH
jgi:hypothetical protein